MNTTDRKLKRASDVLRHRVTDNKERFNYWDEASKCPVTCSGIGISTVDAHAVAKYFEGRYSESIDLNLSIEQIIHS